MKKFLPIFLVIILSLQLISLASCTCSKEELAKLPYGEVLWYRTDPDNMLKEFKTEGHLRVEENEALNLRELGIINCYGLIGLQVRVRNTGAYGILTFHVSCNLDTLDGNNQDSVNTTLGKDGEGYVYFRFWVNMLDIPVELGFADYQQYNEWVNQSFEVQAVNLQDFGD